MNLFHIIGYLAEVSQANGPVVRGYFVDGLITEDMQIRFNEWLEQHDMEIREETRSEAYTEGYHTGYVDGQNNDFYDATED